MTLRALVLVLDRVFEDRVFSKRDRQELRSLIVELAHGLIEDGHDELKELYNRRTRGDYDAEVAEDQAATARMMQEVFEESFGFEFDGPIENLDDLEKAARAQHEEQQRVAEERRAKRKKSAKQLANESQRAEERRRVEKSLQEIYRKLALALHPDHERDEQERARKHELMQLVNAAYEARDLLRLLELQLRFEQIDQADIETMADDRLTHFNQLLAEQCKQLEQQLANVEEPWRHQLDIRAHQKVVPARVLATIQAEIEELDEVTAAARRDVAAFEDPRAVKVWLAANRAATRRAAAAERAAFDAFFRD